MTDALHLKPTFSSEEIQHLVHAHFGLDIEAKLLPGEMDQNVMLTAADGQRFVLKISNVSKPEPLLDLQNQMMGFLKKNFDAEMPQVLNNKEDQSITKIQSTDGSLCMMRLLTFVEGTFWADLESHPASLRHSLGKFLGQLNDALKDFSHPAAYRYLRWDLKHANTVVRQHLHFLSDEQSQWIVPWLEHFERDTLALLPLLRSSVIHNDANDYNILTAEVDDQPRVFSLIDFGDVVDTHTICELAIGCAYALLHQGDPLQALVDVVTGYHEANPLSAEELEVVFSLTMMRLCVSVCLSAQGLRDKPENEYLQISSKPVWDALQAMADLDAFYVASHLKQTCGLLADDGGRNAESLMQTRSTLLNPNLSVAYKKPLKIVRGRGAYLYDESGRAYLDMVNNVCHVGHCHPKVVKAGQRQMAMLNTNTRYLHDNIIEFAERLTDTMPEPLSVCTFVCSGSEANDLAWRMAQAYTDGTDAIVIDGAYHGHLSSIVNLSPYKFDGPGGGGKADHVHIAPMPDPYRGLYRGDDPDMGKRYADHVKQITDQLDSSRRKLAAFFCESIQGVGGQIVMPDEYLKHAYEHVRGAGGVCIADEVQVGMGRVGTHFWAFETQGVVPDIATIGKPLGNGHPVAAVVTTPEIAAAFNNGMEYFNTFGGNPVSCAIGLAVLDVIESEALQQHALDVGNDLQSKLREIQAKHPIIGDVRGLGLFLGIELVLDHDTLEPAAEHAALISERLKNEGILVTTEGPFHNVLKIKPPMVFSRSNADTFVKTLNHILSETVSQ